MGLSADWEKAVTESEKRLKKAIQARIDESESAKDPKERELAKTKGKGNPFFSFPKFKGELGPTLIKYEKAVSQKKADEAKKLKGQLEILIKANQSLVAKFVQYWKPWQKEVFSPLVEALKELEKDLD